MNDILPNDTPLWQHIEQTFRDVAARYGYSEIRLPLLEKTDLFRRTIGEVTDIVEKEMYSFEDRNGDNLSLRPEGTAGCVRAAGQHGLLYNQQQRFWYHGPMFRHERPQKGRYRQFYQFGVEAFGMAGPDVDIEVILLSARFFAQLGLTQTLQLEINNIGNAVDRQRFGAALSAYLKPHADQLDKDSQRRLQSNPLRILDSKSPQTREILEQAPALADFVSEQSGEYYRHLRVLLREVGIDYVESPHLVRGLDYYNNTVFEWTTTALGAQGTVCAGGRYDKLVEKLGGRSTPATGFGMGQERLVLLLESLERTPAELKPPVDVYMVVAGSALSSQALTLAERIRSECPQIRVLSHCGGGKYNSQMKKAYNSGASVAVILEQDTGANENEPVDTVRIRRLDESNEAVSVAVADTAAELNKIFNQGIFD